MEKASLYNLFKQLDCKIKMWTQLSSLGTKGGCFLSIQEKSTICVYFLKRNSEEWDSEAMKKEMIICETIFLKKWESIGCKA